MQKQTPPEAKTFNFQFLAGADSRTISPGASDVDNFDLVNLAEDPGHQDVRRQLHAEMVKFWV